LYLLITDEIAPLSQEPSTVFAYTLLAYAQSHYSPNINGVATLA